MKVYKAPEQTPVLKPTEISIFLAGSIDMGEAENWQEKLTKDLSNFENLIIYNPRRDDWDKSWIQDPTPGTQFHEQVTWELDHIENADLVVLYFADDSKSPITLLELGLVTSDYDKDLVIFCTPKFYRYGNVKIVADRNHVPLYSDYSELLQFIRVHIHNSSIYSHDSSSFDNTKSFESNDTKRTHITGGRVDKGGHNSANSQIKIRPPAPKPIKKSHRP